MALNIGIGLFQDESNTLIVADKSRGTKVITNTFINGFKNACVVHDNYSSYIVHLSVRVNSYV
ncbi:MAG: hypothetical protein Q9M43_09910 [Sulfurimonas sp.]|nr:hypothetical protein [Sulfurimonas sp.]